MTITVNSAANTGLPANALRKPCLIDMSDELSRITWMIEALRSACAGADEEALQTLASVILEQCKDFGAKFEIVRAAERARA